MPLLVWASMERPGVSDKRRFGAYWDDNFQWDLVSRGVAEVRMQIEDCRVPAREKLRIWKEALKSQLGNIIQDRIGEEMEELIRQTQRVEWDKIIVANLETLKRKDRLYEAKMAFLVAYNDDLDEEEKIRRLKALSLTVANNVWNQYLFDIRVPRQTFWHFDDDYGLTNEEWDSAFGNFLKNQEAIRRIPEMHFQRRRLMAPNFGANRETRGEKSS
jgi:hypothetical protein